MSLSIRQIDNALRATGGFVTYAAKKLNVTYNAIYARIQKSPQLQKTVAEIKESYLDLTEHSLIKKIKDEDLGAICFYLKCQGKTRGYVEKQQIEYSGNEKKPIHIKLSQKQIAKQIKDSGIPIPDIDGSDIE